MYFLYLLNICSFYLFKKLYFGNKKKQQNKCTEETTMLWRHLDKVIRTDYLKQ